MKMNIKILRQLKSFLKKGNLYSENLRFVWGEKLDNCNIRLVATNGDVIFIGNFDIKSFYHSMEKLIPSSMNKFCDTFVGKNFFKISLDKKLDIDGAYFEGYLKHDTKTYPNYKLIFTDKYKCDKQEMNYFFNGENMGVCQDMIRKIENTPGHALFNCWENKYGIHIFNRSYDYLIGIMPLRFYDYKVNGDLMYNLT